ncbi:MAG TPA: hypothetical protein VGP28_07020 [Methylocella sp.]|jgi:hypothetical protein|nr:hypothetical protein [Methylocella sp.]
MNKIDIQPRARELNQKGKVKMLKSHNVAATVRGMPVRQIQGPRVELRGNRPAPREESGNNDE